MHFKKVQPMLDRVVYAGYIDHLDWNVKLLQAKHSPLISFQTWQVIQTRLQERTKAPVRKDISKDFALRGFVTCGSCDKLLTACWAKGRHIKYPYYHCRHKGCPDYKKSVRKEKIDQEFGEIIAELKPAPSLFAMAKEMLRAAWRENEKQMETNRQAVKDDLNRLDRKIVQFLGRIVETESPILIQTYEKQVQKLEEEKIVLNEKAALSGINIPSFDEILQTGFSILENPGILWDSEHLEDKRLLLRLAFSERLSYRRNKGFQTASLSLPFSLLEGLKAGDKRMVEIGRDSSNQILNELQNWSRITNQDEAAKQSVRKRIKKPIN